MIAIPNTKDVQPRPYQVPAYESLASAIREYTGPVFIDATVGAGKTVIMGMILKRAQDAGMTAMVIARTGELVEQNADTFRACGVKNSIYSASVGIKSTFHPIIVGSEGTVARSLGVALADQKPDLLLIDECHEVGYDSEDSQYMRIINDLQARNPKMRILGFSGSPFRGSQSIIGDFWKKCVYKIATQELVDSGFLVPTIFGFGHDDVQYNLDDFKVSKEFESDDYSKKDLLAMQKQITGDETITQTIMREVVNLASDRNAVMITGAGKKHLKQISECLPKDSWVIITDSTGNKERRESLKLISSGERKYLLQIGCLTTGYDEPLIDTSVLLRKIGSLRLLIQLLGRGMRLLKPHHIQGGIMKEDHLVLDYTDTMAEMADIYENPILEAASLEIARSRKDVDMLICPACNTQNSPHARRCINRPESMPGVQPMIGSVPNYSIDGRCEHFWLGSDCPNCGAINDQCSRECRKCEYILIDPSKNLTNKHYTDNDWVKVNKMSIDLTRDRAGLVIRYDLDTEPKTSAVEVFYPSSESIGARRAWQNKFLNKHLHKSWHNRVRGKSAFVIIKQKAIFSVPTHITHRVNEKGRSVIHLKKFLSDKK